MFKKSKRFTQKLAYYDLRKQYNDLAKQKLRYIRGKLENLIVIRGKLENLSSHQKTLFSTV